MNTQINKTPTSKMHLTQFSQFSKYSFSQVKDLAKEMETSIATVSDQSPCKDDLRVSNIDVTFRFALVNNEDQQENDTVYYVLKNVIKHQMAKVDAFVVLESNFSASARQGDIAKLIEDKGLKGWMAQVNNGDTINIGAGQRFIVLNGF